ncbi:MAG: CRISPR-associated protein Cas2 [Ferruginibacter sp.]
MDKTFIISYDLAEGSGSEYQELIQAIKAYGTWAHVTKSTWAIVTDAKASEVRDHLISFLPDGSRLFVIKSGSVAAWRNPICRSEWLKKHL